MNFPIDQLHDCGKDNDYILNGIINKNAIVIDIKESCPLTNRFDLISIIKKLIFFRMLFVDFFLIFILGSVKTIQTCNR